MISTILAALLGALFAFLVVFGGDAHKFEDGGLGPPLIVVGFIVAAIVGVVIWERLLPPRFTIELLLGKVDYRFRDQSYALDFAKLNGQPIPEDWRST